MHPNHSIVFVLWKSKSLILFILVIYWIQSWCHLLDSSLSLSSTLSIGYWHVHCSVKIVLVRARLLVLRHRKFRQYFTQTFLKNFGPKIWISPKFATSFNIPTKIVVCKFSQKWKYWRCNFSTNFIEGRKITQERRRNIGNSFAENFGKIVWLQNFIKTATLPAGCMLTKFLFHCYRISNKYRVCYTLPCQTNFIDTVFFFYWYLCLPMCLQLNCICDYNII